VLSHAQLHRLCLLNHHHTGQFAIDRAAANRFIKHAIAHAKDIPPASTSDSGPTTTRVPFNADGTADTVPVPVPVKVTAKMLERERYQRTLREEESEEESGDLKVIDGEEAADDDDKPSEDDSPGQASGVPLAAKGKSRTPPSETGIGKRRRPPIDPFAGLRTFTQSHYPSCFNFFCTSP
jgi:exosome complex protein LRP1